MTENTAFSQILSRFRLFHLPHSPFQLDTTSNLADCLHLHDSIGYLKLILSAEESWDYDYYKALSKIILSKKWMQILCYVHGGIE